MRKFYLCYLMIFIFWAGCTSTGSGRRVDNNVLYSSYPKMVSKFSPDCHCAGKMKKEYEANVLGGGTSSGNYTAELYTWNCSKIRIFVAFKKFKDSNTEWLPVIDIWQHYPNIQDKGGFCKFKNHTYAYCVFKNKNGAFSKIYIRNASDNRIQVVIQLLDLTRTTNLIEFEKNCDDVLRD